MEIDNEHGCEHSNRHDRVLFYRTLYRYSSLPIPDEISGKGGSQPVTDSELALLKEWVALSPMEIVRLLHRAKHTVLLEQDEKQRKTILKEDHRLTIFARDHNIDDVFSYLEGRRVLPFACDCNDLRCICGEESHITYIYNTETHHVLTVGTTCIKSVRMASSDYKRCITCNAPIQGYTLVNLGQCKKCSCNNTVMTGEMKGRTYFSSAAEEYYDPTEDRNISLLDATRILNLKRNMCRMCKQSINRGMRDEEIPGWMEGRRCMSCIFKSKMKLAVGQYAGHDVFSVAWTQLGYDGDDLEQQKGLFDCVRKLFMTYSSYSASKLGFGKFKNLTYLDVVEKQPSYVDWCRTAQDPGQGIRLLLNYADMHNRYVAVSADWPK